MVEPAYIRFDGKGGGEFAFGCVTAGLYKAGGKSHVEFAWGGSDESAAPRRLALLVGRPREGPEGGSCIGCEPVPKSVRISGTRLSSWHGGR